MFNNQIEHTPFWEEEEFNYSKIRRLVEVLKLRQITIFGENIIYMTHVKNEHLQHNKLMHA